MALTSAAWLTLQQRTPLNQGYGIPAFPSAFWTKAVAEEGCSKRPPRPTWGSVSKATCTLNALCVLQAKGAQGPRRRVQQAGPRRGSTQRCGRAETGRGRGLGRRGDVAYVAAVAAPSTHRCSLGREILARGSLAHLQPA